MKQRPFPSNTHQFGGGHQVLVYVIQVILQFILFFLIRVLTYLSCFSFACAF